MISYVYFPRINGVSASIRTFQRELAALDHEVGLIVPEYGPDDERPDWLYRIPSRTVPFDDARMFP
jgi:1,2-diacylglycerol 3-alpha-glucosyltransferase